MNDILAQWGRRNDVEVLKDLFRLHERTFHVGPDESIVVMPDMPRELSRNQDEYDKLARENQRLRYALAASGTALESAGELLKAMTDRRDQLAAKLVLIESALK